MKRMIGSLVFVAALALVGLNVSPDAVAQTKSRTVPPVTKDPPATKTATFELYKDTGGSFRFRLKDPDGEIIATSGKGYKTKDECSKVIAVIKADAAKAQVEDQAGK